MHAPKYTSVLFRPLKWLISVIFVFIFSGITAAGFAIDGKEVSLCKTEKYDAKSPPSFIELLTGISLVHFINLIWKRHITNTAKGKRKNPQNRLWRKRE